MKTWKLMDNAISLEQREKLSEFILNGDKFSQGDLVREFEIKWSEWQGCKYSVFVNSGSSANFLAVYAMSPMGRKHWISQACTWATTVSPIMMSGNHLQLCDVTIPSITPCMDSLRMIFDRVEPDYLFLANLLGFSAIDDELLDLCETYSVDLLEDCCESHGATFKGNKIGNFGKISTFSFYYGHHMTTIEGGMVCTDDEEIYERLLLLRSHGLLRELPQENQKKYKHEMVNENFTFMVPGFNCRSTDFNAYLGLMQLENLDNHIQIRRSNFNKFASGLDSSKFYTDFRTEGNSSFCFPVIMRDRSPKDIIQKLSEEGVETRPIIAGNLYEHPFMKSTAQYRLDDNAKIVHNNGFYVGNNHNVVIDDVQWLVDFLNGVE